MTEQQVNRIVEHLCEQLHTAIQLKGSNPPVRPPNLKELGFEQAFVKTALLTGLRLAGVTIQRAATDTSEEPPWS